MLGLPSETSLLTPWGAGSLEAYAYYWDWAECGPRTCKSQPQSIESCGAATTAGRCSPTRNILFCGKANVARKKGSGSTTKKSVLSLLLHSSPS
jgi:hypothetical protein